MRAENKYLTVEKAFEYAKMSWPFWPENEISEPFYARVTSEIADLSGQIASENPTCVEFGFGAGRIMFELSRLLPASRIVGVELSPAMIEISKLYLRGSRVNLVNANAEESSLGSSLSDLTVSVNMLDRVRNTTNAVRELVRVTRDGGSILVVSAFDYETPLTPLPEHLTMVQMTELFESLGCSLMKSLGTELIKILPDGNLRKFDETILVFKKRLE